MQIQVLKSPDQVRVYVSLVREAADSHKSELGFLRAGVYTEQAAHGHLWVAVEGDPPKLAGFLLFGGTFPHIRIFQLFVLKHARKTGVAASLIKELADYGEAHNFLTITAKVAAELPANLFWNKQKFRIVSQLPGGTARGRSINLRLRELESPALFRFEDARRASEGGFDKIRFSHMPILSNRTYVLDLNVFFDLIRHRLNRESAQRIMTAALANEIRVLVCPEFVQELERHTNASGVDPVLEFARTLPTLPKVDADYLAPLISRLQLIIFANPDRGQKSLPHDLSDVTHLAYCIHHRATGFLTSEKAILRCSDKIRDDSGVEILAPSDLVDSISIFPEDDQRHSVSASLAFGQVTLTSLSEQNRGAAETYLSKKGLAAPEIAAVLDPGTSVARRRRLIARVDGILVGLTSWSHKHAKFPELHAHLYVEEASPVCETVLDHFIECIQREGPYTDFKRITIWFNSAALKTRETLAARGFRRASDAAANRDRECYIKASFKGPITKANWRRFSRAFSDLTNYRLPLELPSHDELRNTGFVLKLPNTTLPLVAPLFDFETLISPGFVLAVGREAALVPIREAYSKTLITLDDPQLDLLPAKEASLRLEKAYFLAPQRHQLFAKGTLVIFYVSGAAKGRKQAIGIARSTFSDTISFDQAQVSLARQGVLSEKDLKKRAGKSGKLTAFTFDNFIPFARPVPYSTLKELHCISAANLVTAERLSFEKLQKIVSNAF